MVLAKFVEGVEQALEPVAFDPVWLTPPGVEGVPVVGVGVVVGLVSCLHIRVVRVSLTILIGQRLHLLLERPQHQGA